MQPTCSHWSAFERNCVKNKDQYYHEADCFENKYQNQYEARHKYKTGMGVLILEMTYFIFMLCFTTLVFALCLISGIQDAHRVYGIWPFILYGVFISIGLVMYCYQYRAFENQMTHSRI